MKKTLIFLTLILFVLAAFNWVSIVSFVQNGFVYSPCNTPIPYSIGMIDTRFHVDADELLTDTKIATNILASRLQGLEENGIVKKLDHPESKAKVLYTLTQKGIDLLPILLEIYFWADKYFSIPAEIKARIKEAKKDKEGFIKSLTKELKSNLTQKKSSS